MLYLKKYFTEGLIQMAILLSLCGVMVDVGLESPAWQEMIAGPTSALTQTQFHNLRNRLENSRDLHPKNQDLDGFFTARRLLGWVHSLDRLQVPHAEVETWLVQHEPGPLPLGRDQSPPLQRDRDHAAPLGRDQSPPLQRDRDHAAPLGRDQSPPLQRATPGVDRDLAAPLGRDQSPPLQRAPPGVDGDHAAPPVDSRAGLGSFLEEDLEDKEEEMQHPLGAEEEEEEEDNMEEDVAVGMERRRGGETTPNEGDQNSFSFQECLRLLEETFPFTEEHQVCDVGGRGGDVGPLLPPPTSAETPSLDLELHWQDLLAIMEPQDTDVDMMTSFVTQNSKEVVQSVGCESGATPDQEATPTQNGLFLPLTPSAELDHQRSALNPEHCPGSQFAPQPEKPPPTDSCHSRDFTSSSPDLTSPFLVEEEEDDDDEGGLPSPLCDLFQDAVILDEIRLLDEGFSPEMAAQSEEESFLNGDVSQQKINRNDGVRVTEDQDQPTRHQQDAEDQVDSDSGLSLDFSRSPASSESSSYSSSSASSSSGSPFSEDEGEVGSLMEVEMTIKQERLEEEEMGAVGGDIHKFPSNLGQLYHWMEHVDHDHTYNQQWSSPSLGMMPTKHTKTSSRNAKPYSSSGRISESRMWSQDERRARSRKIPFSNELIVNLPVEEFNDLLTNHQLSEDQLVLIRDIRRRGKNKIAAQNCRKRKMDVLLELEGDVSGLRRYRSQLLREKQEAVKHLQEMKRRLGALYQDVFSRLRDEDGAPLNAMEHVLNFEADGSVTVASLQESTALPQRRTSKKHRDKKK